MSLKTTTNGRQIFKKADSLLLFPYVYDSDLNDFVLGHDVYDISAIIGDSIALEQKDGDSTIKNNEFTNEPLIKNVTIGEWNITAQCLDLQNIVLKSLFGAYTNGSYGVSAIRKEYETMYAMIRISFSDDKLPYVVFPKVLLNSKLMLQQMRSRGSQGNIDGVVLPRKCAVILQDAVAGGTPGTLIPFEDSVNLSTIYETETPILFVPKSNRVLIFHHRDEANERTYYDELKEDIASSQDCFSHGRYTADDDTLEEGEYGIDLTY